MRKLKLQVQTKIDGFISGQNGEMDWMKFPWTDDIVNYVREITKNVDTIVLGRKLAEGFIPHWENVAKDPNNPEYEGGIKYAKTPKIVFTKTIKKSIWENTDVANGELVEEINKLKNLNGKLILSEEVSNGTLSIKGIRSGVYYIEYNEQTPQRLFITN